MAFTQDFRTQRRNYNDGETRIGEKDRLWYDSNTNTIRISDGVTPGGVTVGGGSGSGGDTGVTNQLVNGDFNFILGVDGTVNFSPSGANGKGVLQTAADLQFIAVDKTWTFGTDGTLTFPNSTVQTTAWTGNGPAFRAYVDTNQTIVQGAQCKVTFGTENFDTDGCFASSKFTPNVEGYYQFNATVRISGTSGTGEVMIILYKNGVEYARGINESGAEQGNNFYSMSVSDIAYASGTTDNFEVYIQQSSGADRTTTAGSAISYFSGCMIRGA